MSQPHARNDGHPRRFTVSHGASGPALDVCSRRSVGRGHFLCKQVLACRRYQQQDASLNAARYGIGSVAIACATRGQLGEVVEGDVPDDFDDELGREFGGGVV